MKSLVSICIPVFNGAAFLSESLESVISQSYQFLDIIIVDDGSSDSSLTIAEDYAKKDDRIRVIKNPRNLGLVQNWNRCIELVSGDWFKLHFQDDIMEPNCISDMLEFAIHNNIGLVLSDRKYFYESEVNEKQKDFYERRLKKLDANIERTRFVAPEEIAEIFTENFLGANFLGEPIVGLLKKDRIAKYGDYDPQLSQICDFEFWLRISLNEGLGFVKKPLTQFRVHGSSQTVRNAKDKKSKKSVSLRVIDRIHLGLKIMKSDFYLTYRLYVKNTCGTTIEKLVVSKFTEYIVSIGYFKSKKLFGPEILAYFSYRPFTFLKALYNDMARLGI